MIEPGSPESGRRDADLAGGPPPGEGGRLLGGRYRLLKLLGSGGMGSVYLCEHATLGRRCAVKVLHASRALDPELVERFRQEAQAASRIAHENVVEVVDFGQDEGGDLYYVMEMLEGRTLGQLMAQEGPLPVPRALALLEQLCRALQAAHARGVVHRDVKPANILVESQADGTERVKLIDFGISHVPGADRMTLDGEIIGTPEYMAPEQASGGEVDPLTDVYAAGVLAFELLTGTLPLVGKNAIATLVAHQSHVPPRVGTRRAGVPPELDRLVQRALAKRPGDRFPSMEAMAAEVMRVRLRLNLASASAAAPAAPPVESGAPAPQRWAGGGATPGPGDTVLLPALPPLVSPASSARPEGQGEASDQAGPATREVVRLARGRPATRLAVAAAVLVLLGALGFAASRRLGGAEREPRRPRAAVPGGSASEPANGAPAPAPVAAAAAVESTESPVPAASPQPPPGPPSNPPPAPNPRRGGELRDPYATPPEALKPNPFQ